jgi:hypothetical protein
MIGLCCANARSDDDSPRIFPSRLLFDANGRSQSCQGNSNQEVTLDSFSFFEVRLYCDWTNGHLQSVHILLALFEHYECIKTH